MLRALALAFAAAAVVLLLLAMRDMARHRNERRGGLLRGAALACFGMAVLLNVLRG